MSREHVHRGSLTSLRRSSLVNAVLESASSKIFPLESDIEFDINTSRRSSIEHYRGCGVGGGGSIQEPLMGRVGTSRNIEGKTKVHPKR